MISRSDFYIQYGTYKKEHNEKQMEKLFDSLTYNELTMLIDDLKGLTNYLTDIQRKLELNVIEMYLKSRN